MSGLDKAIKFVGTQRILAEKLGVSRMAVSKWSKTRVPAERCKAIEHLTNGAVTVNDLRPDVFGDAA